MLWKRVRRPLFLCDAGLLPHGEGWGLADVDEGAQWSMPYALRHKWYTKYNHGSNAQISCKRFNLYGNKGLYAIYAICAAPCKIYLLPLSGSANLILMDWLTSSSTSSAASLLLTPRAACRLRLSAGVSSSSSSSS